MIQGLQIQLQQPW